MIKQISKVFIVDHLIENTNEVERGVLLNLWKICENKFDVFVVASFVGLMKYGVAKGLFIIARGDQLGILQNFKIFRVDHLEILKDIW